MAAESETMAQIHRMARRAVRERRVRPAPVACAPCVLVEGPLTTYLHENEPYVTRHWPGFTALVSINDGHLVGVQFPS